MINKLKALLASKLGGNNPSTILYSDKPTGQPPMSLIDVEEQNEIYLALATGEGTYKGVLTGLLAGTGGAGFILISVFFLWRGRYEPALACFLVTLLSFSIPFVFEVLRPLPPPILFNRRTREVYHQQDGKVLHAPWDEIAAIAYEFHMLSPYAGSMRHASLEVLVCYFGNPDKQLLLSLGLPVGKSLELQESLWEYLRSYMNNGPWFDELGNHSVSDEFVRSQLEIAGSGGRLFRNTWDRIVVEYKNSGGREFLDFTDIYLLFAGVLFSPMNTIQEFTYSVAKRRSRKQWPKLITERLDPSGPTTRLIDIERASQIKQEPDQGGMGQ